MAEIPILKDLLEYRKQLQSKDQLIDQSSQVNEQLKPSKYSLNSLEAIIIAIIIAIVFLFIYAYVGKTDVRYSTGLTVMAVAFLLTMSVLDSPEKKFFQIVTAIIFVLVLIEIVGYEVLRIIKLQNRMITYELLGI